MPIILIADACKPSLVMSSEVFKDKITGATILVATTGRQCLEILAEHKPDMCVVDFDLPDADGITLIHAMRKTYRGPILLTAYPEKIVEEAVRSDLFAFNDAGGWIPKPVKFDVLAAKIDQFLLDKFRLGRRFDIELDTMIIGKGAGRGKRAPKVTGKITNVSLGGVCIELDEPMRMKNGEEMLLALDLPAELIAQSTPKPVAKKPPVRVGNFAKGAGKNARGTLAPPKKQPRVIPDARVKCTVAWVDRKGLKVGFQFARLSDVQKRSLEDLLRGNVVDG
jgi:CheY-like chemotaxis protein